MAEELELTPELLLQQSQEMSSLKAEYEALLNAMVSDLKGINDSWSERLSSNFSAKIQSAQKSFSGVLTMLGNGSSAIYLAVKKLKEKDSQLASRNAGDAFSISTAKTTEELQSAIAESLAAQSPSSESSCPELVAVSHEIPYIHGHPGGSGFDTSAWPAGYSGSGCAVAATAMALSGLTGTSVTPKEIMAAQGNSISMQWSNICSSKDLNVAVDYSATTSELDAALEKYLSNPDKYSAPIIGAEGGGQSHFAVVTGKNADGSYQIIEGSGWNATTYRNTSTYSLNKSGFTGQLCRLVQYENTHVIFSQLKAND